MFRRVQFQVQTLEPVFQRHAPGVEHGGKRALAGLPGGQGGPDALLALRQDGGVVAFQPFLQQLPVGAVEARFGRMLAQLIVAQLFGLILLRQLGRQRAVLALAGEERQVHSKF